MQEECIISLEVVGMLFVALCTLYIPYKVATTGEVW
jgi:hypothetical protein